MKSETIQALLAQGMTYEDIIDSIEDQLTEATEKLEKATDWKKFKGFLYAEHGLFHQYQDGNMSIGKLLSHIIRIAKQALQELGNDGYNKMF